MRMSRVFLWGSSIGVVAALVYVGFDGLLAAAALMILVFTMLVTVGLSIGLALERSPGGSLKRSIRSIRSSLSGLGAGDLCGTCRGPTVVIHSMKVCPECDLIAAAS